MEKGISDALRQEGAAAVSDAVVPAFDTFLEDIAGTGTDAEPDELAVTSTESTAAHGQIRMAG